MHSIHLKHLHAPKGPNVFAFSIGEVVWCALALIFFLVSWAVGGDAFKESIGGAYTLVVLLAGILIGAVFGALSRPDGGRKEPGSES